MRKILQAAVAVAIAAAVSPSAHAAGNLVQNGSFTANTIPGSVAAAGFNGAEVDPFYLYPNAVTNWTTNTSGYPQAYNLYFFGTNVTGADASTRYGGEPQRPNVNFPGLSPDGGAFMLLDADPNFTGPLQQTINGLTVGKKYELSFYWAGGELSNRTGYETAQLTGSFGADAFATNVVTNSHPYYNNPGNLPGDFSPWTKMSFGFTAQSTSQVLSFLAAGTPSMNLPPVALLDGVSLTAVPEPSVWALSLMGVAALGGSLRLKRRRTGVAAATA